MLRFYTPEGLVESHPEDFSYLNQMQQLKDVNAELGENSTSLIKENNGESTVPLYKTDAPELQDEDSESDDSLQQTDEPTE